MTYERCRVIDTSVYAVFVSGVVNMFYNSSVCEVLAVQRSPYHKPQNAKEVLMYRGASL